jgi:hypothetical protein
MITKLLNTLVLHMRVEAVSVTRGAKDSPYILVTQMLQIS